MRPRVPQKPPPNALSRLRASVGSAPNHAPEHHDAQRRNDQRDDRDPGADRSDRGEHDPDDTDDPSDATDDDQLEARFSRARRGV